MIGSLATRLNKISSAPPITFLPRSQADTQWLKAPTLPLIHGDRVQPECSLLHRTLLQSKAFNRGSVWQSSTDRGRRVRLRVVSVQITQQRSVRCESELPLSGLGLALSASGAQLCAARCLPSLTRDSSPVVCPGGVSTRPHVTSWPAGGPEGRFSTSF